MHMSLDTPKDCMEKCQQFVPTPPYQPCKYFYHHKSDKKCYLKDTAYDPGLVTDDPDAAYGGSVCERKYLFCSKNIFGKVIHIHNPRNCKSLFKKQTNLKH